GGFCMSVKPVVGAEADVTMVLGTLGSPSGFLFGFLFRLFGGSLRQRVRHYGTAFLAGARIFVVEEPLVGLRNGIGAIVADHESLLVQEIAAALAVPVKLVDLAGVALPFDDQREGVGRETRRMRGVRRHPVGRAFVNDRDLFFPLRR